MTHTLRLVDPLSDRAELAPGDFQTVGAYLRAVRERRGRSLVELAAATRIRRAYLAAIEEADYAVLPSRPFAIGYVRAYANVLELDGEAAAERFKLEMPAAAEALRAPIGVKHDKPERRPLFFAAGAVIVAAVIGWNIVQRAMTTENEPAPPPLPAPVAEAPPPQGPISLGAPTPPPAEQTTPEPYVTPGLGPVPVTDPLAEAPATAKAEIVPAVDAPKVFSTRSAIYGSVADGPAVVLQARKPGSLIIRGPGGEVYFARQLTMGEAYRAPIGRKLQAEVTDPAAFSVYINGQLQGALALPQTTLDKVAAAILRAAPVTPVPAAAGSAAPRPAARPSVDRPAATAAPVAATSVQAAQPVQPAAAPAPVVAAPAPAPVQ